MARTTSSLAGEFWGGYCPECLTPEAEMCKNSDGNWECGHCHLQIQVLEEIVVLPENGVGKFVKQSGSRISVLDMIPTQEGRILQDLRV